MKKLFLFTAVLLAANLTHAQWEPDARLTNDPFSSITLTSNNAHAIATSGDTLHVVWYENRDGNCEIYYKRSIDGGLTWGEDIRLTNAPDNSWDPSISVSGSVVHVVWEDHRDSDWEIYYKRSTDGGNNWGSDTRLTYSTGNTWYPALAISGELVHLVYYDYCNGWWEIYYKRSTDGGLTWESDTRMTNDPAMSLYASVAVSGPVVHVVWTDIRDGNGEIYYKHSSDDGAHWGQDVRLTIDDSLSTRPCVMASGVVVHIVWYDKRDGNREIYYKGSQDGGSTWGADTRLTNSSGDSFGPSLAVSGSAVHVAWYDKRDGDLEIYYKRSEDEGLNWGTDTRLTNATGDSEYPSLAVSGPMVHVVWTDLRDGNEEIYYKRDPTGGFAVGTENDLAGTSGQKISIWPNPASNGVHISLNYQSNLLFGKEKGKIVITIRNILGEELLSKQIQNGEAMIDVSNLQNGFYFISVKTSKNKVISTKLIIVKE
jgi:hypothetical protein